MIKVKKDFNTVPDILNSDNRKKAFKNNIRDKNFNHGTSLYKPDELKKQLHEIYNLKCVYCEDSLLNAPKHVEHYRPKDIYYWLGYSWDNLLLCCGSCNSSKGINFKTINDKVKYNNENYENIHKLGDDYDKSEKPELINPEKDDIIKYIIFNRDAEISSENRRVIYTIETCNLNRDELLKLRIEIVNDFIQLVNSYYLQFDESSPSDKSELVKSFVPLVQKFIKDCNKEKKFYSLRYYMIKNIELFFNYEDKRIINILNHLFLKLNS